MYRGTRLAGVEEWHREYDPELTELELAFLDASSSLRDREQHEHERRRRRTVQMLAGGFIIATALLLFAASQWWRAEEQFEAAADALRTAEQERARAERRFRDVQGLASTFLFDVHDAIAGLPGSVPARKQIVEKALAYLTRLEQDAGNDPGLQRDLWVGHTRIGDVQLSLDDSAAALASHQIALGIALRLARSQPTNDQAQYDLSISYDNVGRVLHIRKNLNTALNSFRASLALRERLAQANPADAQVQRGLAVS